MYLKTETLTLIFTFFKNRQFRKIGPRIKNHCHSFKMNNRSFALVNRGDFSCGKNPEGGPTFA